MQTMVYLLAHKVFDSKSKCKDTRIERLNQMLWLGYRERRYQVWNIYFSQMRAFYSFWYRQLKFSANAVFRIFWNLTKFQLFRQLQYKLLHSIKRTLFSWAFFFFFFQNIFVGTKKLYDIRLKKWQFLHKKIENRLPVEFQNSMLPNILC